MTKLTWKHDELAEDLAIAKGGIPFLNQPLGQVVWAKGKTPRADLVVCRPSYTRFCISIYEVKKSRADFLSDIRSEKWRDYLPHCHRFFFAVAEGICTIEDIPAGAGLVIRNENGWYTRKAPSERDVEISAQTMMALIFSKQKRSEREKRLDDVEAMGEEYYEHQRKDFSGRLKAARVLGKLMGQLHEAAMQLEGLEDGIQVLKDEKERRYNEMLERIRSA